MGIYIDNIEMPKGHKYLTINIWPNGTTSYGIFNREENLCTFKETKAISVPSHGDLIDRDMLTISTAVPLDGKPYQYVSINNIKAAPLIIPAEKG